VNSSSVKIDDELTAVKLLRISVYTQKIWKYKPTNVGVVLESGCLQIVPQGPALGTSVFPPPPLLLGAAWLGTFLHGGGEGGHPQGGRARLRPEPPPRRPASEGGISEAQRQSGQWGQRGHNSMKYIFLNRWKNHDFLRQGSV